MAPDRKDRESTPDEADVSVTETKDDSDAANPPRTTTGKMTSPKFGSATSGGGELEPGLPKN